ncbi:MAG TPA: D-arabinono-1,4-lactone oxidase [Streptosporangiaceae bacterium]|nr:D-arabinono-1,4-lactone oxidase [Streptosporangiaceae bacterium]
MTWQNWAGTASADPARRRWPRSAEDISDAVTTAAKDGLTVRALGSGHSFTPAAVTSGVALDLSGWTGIVAADLESGLITVRSGTTLRDLNAALDALGLAMANLGDIDAQTISGAISTGTHGTGARLGGLAAQVAGLELVLADGSIVACSADERPDLFAAARIGLGALGVLTAVTFRVVPAFLLTAVEEPMRWSEVVGRLDELTSANEHFEFYWFPHTDGCLTKRNNRSPGPARPLPRWRYQLDDEFLSNTLFGAVCAAGHRAPGLIPRVNRLASRALSARTYTDTSYKVFTSPRRVRFKEQEYAVPRAALADVLTGLRSLIEARDWRISFPIEVRVTPADDLWLSTAYGRDSAYLALHVYHRSAHEAYFAGTEALLVSAGGRPHWGKMHSRDAGNLAAAYPMFGKFTALRDELDPDRRFANPYLTRVLGP